MYSILHISDLHRSRDEPVDNDSLVAALLADRDRYIGETPPVPLPQAIIVSGDIIQGASMDQPNWDAAVQDQYQVAHAFLDHLARRFLAGDRSKVIVVPGNHDVCWNTSRAAMQRVPENEYPRDIHRALIEPGSNYRWSWSERALYRITDAETYRRRMSAYWSFVRDFYADVPLLQDVDPERGYQLFELFDRRTVVAAFDSTYGNDCFDYCGAMAPGTVGRCALDLRDLPHTYGLRIAVWHHSVQGPPRREDYMDVAQVHEMVGLGFQLGIHGHQHIAEATSHHVHLSESQSMAVVSAGSLCAGARELPRGINRQYNVIVIDDNLQHARVHAREMTEGDQFSRKRTGAFFQGFVDIGWELSRDDVGRVVDPDERNDRRAILLAEEALHAGDPAAALSALESTKLAPGSHGRRVALEAAQDLEAWPKLIELIGEPTSVEEAVLLVNAYIRQGSFETASEVLRGQDMIDAATSQALADEIRVQAAMRKR